MRCGTRRTETKRQDGGRLTAESQPHGGSRTGDLDGAAGALVLLVVRPRAARETFVAAIVCARRGKVCHV